MKTMIAIVLTALSLNANAAQYLAGSINGKVFTPSIFFVENGPEMRFSVCKTRIELELDNYVLIVSKVQTVKCEGDPDNTSRVFFVKATPDLQGVEYSGKTLTGEAASVTFRTSNSSEEIYLEERAGETVTLARGFLGKR